MLVDSSQDRNYDLAVSFAGEHRDYVEDTVRACADMGLRVFYDRDMSNEWWGKNFIREQRKVYGSQTRYFVPSSQLSICQNRSPWMSSRQP